MIAGLVHLIAPGARIMPLKAFAEDGTAQTSDIGLHLLRRKQRRLGHQYELQRERHFQRGDAGGQLRTRRNVICVASTGNAGTQAIVYPASYGYVLEDTSVNTEGYLSTFSNYGPAITAVAAPGENLVTTYPGGNYAAARVLPFLLPSLPAVYPRCSSPARINRQCPTGSTGS